MLCIISKTDPYQAKSCNNLQNNFGGLLNKQKITTLTYYILCFYC